VDRELKFFQAINEAIDLCMAKDPTVHIMGLGVPDPKGVFGTTTGLAQKYGSERVSDLPTSENAMTGVAIGTAIAGMRPIMTHHRLDFALLAMEQIVNQAAKWHYMFGGRMRVPLTVRMVIGRGWGQGPQHSQSLQAWFAHVPGLKVVMPANAHDAKGLLISSIEDDNPVMFLEHRWLYNISGPVPEGLYRVPLGRGRVVIEGGDVTIVACSYMTVEAYRAALILAEIGVRAEVVDLRSVRPWDELLVLESVRRTGRLIVADTSWTHGGFGAEVVARVVEAALDALKAPPQRIGLADCPAPTSPALAARFYPRAKHIAITAAVMLGKEPGALDAYEDSKQPLDAPDPTFVGPF
jgi:pyruvate dehydrogenase E1 component beta subunit